MCNLENATVKLILNDSKHVVGICKIKLESKMKKHFMCSFDTVLLYSKKLLSFALFWIPAGEKWNPMRYITC